MILLQVVFIIRMRQLFIRRDTRCRLTVPIGGY